MPIALDTQEIFRYVFSTDRAKPVEEQPTLLFHFPTCKETTSIASMFDESDKAKTVAESIKLRCDAIRLILASWEKFKDRKGNTVSYDPNKLEEILTDTDLTELNGNLLRDMGASEVEKKVFAFSALFKAESSAANAKAANV